METGYGIRVLNSSSCETGGKRYRVRWEQGTDPVLNSSSCETGGKRYRVRWEQGTDPVTELVQLRNRKETLPRAMGTGYGYRY